MNEMLRQRLDRALAPQRHAMGRWGGDAEIIEAQGRVSFLGSMVVQQVTAIRMQPDKEARAGLIDDLLLYRDQHRQARRHLAALKQRVPA